MTENFFPNLSAEAMMLEAKFRRVVSNLKEEDRLKAYEVYTAAHPECVETTFSIQEEFIIARQAGIEIAFPRPLPMVKHAHLSCGYEIWLQRKYTLPGFVAVEPGDVVVDCGAYVGGFSLGACRIASQVHVFEPEHANFVCAKRNLAQFKNALLNMAGLYNETTELSLNISSSGVEHSFLSPDAGGVIEKRKVVVYALADYCFSRGVSTLDFVKVEAEGVEPEVVSGMRELRPRKLAIDVSPEREGESPAKAIAQLLESQNYSIRRRGNVLFAKIAE